MQACALHVHGMCTACALHVHAHCVCTACAPHVHRMCTACAPLHCIACACMCMCMLHVRRCRCSSRLSSWSCRPISRPISRRGRHRQLTAHHAPRARSTALQGYGAVVYTTAPWQGAGLRGRRGTAPLQAHTPRETVKAPTATGHGPGRRAGCFYSRGEVRALCCLSTPYPFAVCRDCYCSVLV